MNIINAVKLQRIGSRFGRRIKGLIGRNVPSWFPVMVDAVRVILFAGLERNSIGLNCAEVAGQAKASSDPVAS
jgi:hypothetical protein